MFLICFSHLNHCINMACRSYIISNNSKKTDMMNSNTNSTSTGTNTTKVATSECLKPNVSCIQKSASNTSCFPVISSSTIRNDALFKGSSQGLFSENLHDNTDKNLHACNGLNSSYSQKSESLLVDNTYSDCFASNFISNSSVNSNSIKSHHISETREEGYNSVHPCATKVFSSYVHIERLSRGTRNFLNELIASHNNTTFCDNVSDYALSSINPLFISKTKENDVTDCSNKMNMSLSNDKNASLSNDHNITDNKDATHALDLIEISPLHDGNVVSTKVCNKLNQIFSKENVAVSASIAPSSESSVIDKNSSDHKTIALQTKDSNVSLISGVEADTINTHHSDLCEVHTPKLGQQIVLVQDKSQNIEIALFFPDGAKVEDASHQLK